MASPGTGSTAVQVKRTFAAPREKVFQAWTDPKLMTRWFARGPGMPPVEVAEADARTGGKYRVKVFCPPEMRPGEGQAGATGLREFHMEGTYKEVRPPEKLVFTWWWQGADFETSQVTVDFRALGESNFTEVTLTHELLPEKEREEHRQGWIGCMDMLEKTLKGEL